MCPLIDSKVAHEPANRSNRNGEIRREKVRLAFSHLPTMQFTSFIVALVLMFAVRRLVTRAMIASWLLMILAIVASRIVLGLRFDRVKDTSFDGERWASAYLVLALVSGVLWGASAFLVFPAGDLPLVSMFVLVMASLSAATTVSHSSITLAPAAWAAPALLAYAVRCVVEGGEPAYMIAVLIVIYLATVLRYSFLHHASVTRAIELRYENLDLLDEVQRANETLNRDIEERWRAEVALRESENRFHALFENARDGIFIHLTSGRFVEANREACERLQYSRDEFLKLGVQDIVAPEHAALVPERMARLMRDGHEIFESVHRRRDGTTLPVEVVAQLFEHGGKTLVLSVIRDITERRHAEDALRRSEEFARSILDNIADGFLVVDRGGQIVAANRAYCEWVGALHDDIVGKSYEAVAPSRPAVHDDSTRRQAVARALETGAPQVVLLRQPDEKGDTRRLEARAFPLRDSSGEVVSVIETIHDATSRYLLEEERLKSQKLEALGTLAGGIAHDFNNLLQGVFGYVSMAKLAVPADQPAFPLIEQAEQALGLSVNLTSQLLTFAKGGRPVKKRVELRGVIETAARFALAGSRSNYRLDVDGRIHDIEADPGQIAQVIQNIVLNAAEAMPDGGTVRIAVRNVEIRDGALPVASLHGNAVLVAIKDSGTGMPEEHLSRIFDPYFTTKHHGSGLGLATTYSIVRNHGGVITVRSKLGRGSTFYVFLPALPPDLEAGGETAVTSAPRVGRILLMDDEEMVRRVATAMMTSLGHDVRSAEDGLRALAMFAEARALGQPFDVVVLDLTVKGGMGGRQALERLRAIDPDVKAIVSSGYSEDPVVADYRLFGFSACLNKPYIMASLRETLNAVLAS